MPVCLVTQANCTIERQFGPRYLNSYTHELMVSFRCNCVLSCQSITQQWYLDSSVLLSSHEPNIFWTTSLRIRYQTILHSLYLSMHSIFNKCALTTTPLSEYGELATRFSYTSIEIIPSAK
jgi:hypothetical protein